MKIKGWLDMASHDPFGIGPEKLGSLDSGLVAGDDVNCDEAEMIGSQIQQSLANLSWNNAIVKQSLKAVTLASLNPFVKINDAKIIVDPPVPASLFDGYIMRKSKKSSLAKGLGKLLANSNEEVIEVPQEAEDDIDEDDIDSIDEFDDINDITSSITASITTKYVIDGGYLLRRVMWDKNITFREIINKYLRLDDKASWLSMGPSFKIC